jgi:hypothetical protein
LTPATPGTDLWSEEGVAKFGRMVAELLSSVDAKSARDLIDVEGLAKRVIGGLPLEPDDAGKTLAKTTGIIHEQWAEVFAGAAGHPTKLLGARSKGGFPSCLLRGIGADGQPTYAEILLRPHGNSFRIVDTFSFNCGLHVSELLRPQILPALAANYTKDVAALLKVDEAWMRDGSPVAAMLNASARGTRAEVMTAAAALPQTVRLARGLRPYLVQAALELHETDFIASIQRLLWQKNPQDIGFGLLAYAEFARESDMVSARRLLSVLESEIGGDAMLKISRAQLFLSEVRFEEAAETLDAAAKQEPDLDMGLGLRLTRFLGRQDFCAAIAVLEDYQKTTGQRISADDLIDPIFRELRSSMAFANWQKGQPFEADSKVL